MRYDAILFDLFGTLIDDLPLDEWLQAHADAAAVLSLDVDEMMRVWNSTRPQRDVGSFGSMEGDIEHACALLGPRPDARQVSQVVRIRLDTYRRALQPRVGAVETLAALRAMGHRVGLISDCGLEIPRLWNETPLAPLIDEAIFSCAEGMAKPDSRIYNLACERLGVGPERCLYVGDGGSDELAGARRVGMRPVLIRVERHCPNITDRIDPADWDGPLISELAQVLDLLGEPTA